MVVSECVPWEMTLEGLMSVTLHFFFFFLFRVGGPGETWI